MVSMEVWIPATTPHAYHYHITSCPVSHPFAHLVQYECPHAPHYVQIFLKWQLISALEWLKWLNMFAMISCFFSLLKVRIAARRVRPASSVDGCWLFPDALLLAYIRAQAGFSFMFSRLMLQLIGCADTKVTETRCGRCSIKIRTDLLTLFVTSSVHPLPTHLGAKSSSQSLLIHPFFYHPSRTGSQSVSGHSHHISHTSRWLRILQHGFGMPGETSMPCWSLGNGIGPDWQHIPKPPYPVKLHHHKTTFWFQVSTWSKYMEIN